MAFSDPTDFLLAGGTLASTVALATIGGMFAVDGIRDGAAAMVPGGIVLPILVVFGVAWLLDS